MASRGLGKHPHSQRWSVLQENGQRTGEQQQSLTDMHCPRGPGAVLTLHPSCIGRIRDPAGQGAVLLLVWILT